MAGEEIGRAEIEVHADTTGFPGEVKRGVEAGLHDVDPSLKKAGEDWGDTVSKSLGERMKTRFSGIIQDITSRFKREKIVEHIEIEPDYDKDHVRSFVHKIASDIEGEIGGNKGTLSKIGNGIGSAIFDGIGAAFNVSGKSPLIALLIPVIGGIAALILAAVEAVYGLAAALFTIPSILAAIVTEAGVLFLVFKAVAPVVSAVLNAKNAKEMREALMGVAEPIANFAKSLLPIRDFFELLGKSAAVEFFKQMGDVVSQIFNANSREFFFGIIKVAGALGDWFHEIGKAFASPQFTKFLGDLFKSIDSFLSHNGPYFSKFLEQMFTFLDKMLDPAGALGALINLLVINFGNWLEEASKNPKFLDWLDKMPVLLLDLGEALGALIDLFSTLFQDIDEQGGEGFLENFTTAVKVLNDIFQSDAGKLAIKALIQLIDLLGLAFIGLVVVIVGVFAFLEKLGQWIGWVIDRIREFINWIGGLGDTFKLFLNGLFAPFEGLPNRFYHIGVSAIQGFIAGMLHMKNPAMNTAGQVIGAVAGAFPSSPAKYGPFSGDGAPFDRGISAMKDFTKGIMAESGNVNNSMSTAMNSNFGPGAVVANFYGQNPTPQQAQIMGQALGNSINDQLAVRNARLAVRTM